MDAPFYPPTDAQSEKAGKVERLSICRTRGEDDEVVDPTFVAIGIVQGERVDKGPNPQELLVMGAVAITQRLEAPGSCNKTISSDCTSLVDYVHQ